MAFSSGGRNAAAPGKGFRVGFSQGAAARRRGSRKDDGRVNAPLATRERLGTVLEALAAMRALPPAAVSGESAVPGSVPGIRPSMDPVDPRHLVELWRNWSMVMGPDLAPLALPLGRRNEVLIVGGEDNLCLQELSFQTPEILERVNAFMDAPPHAPVFRRVELRLVMGQRPLHLPPDIQSRERFRPPPPRPARLGGHLSEMREDSPVARCYAAYLRMHGLLPDAETL